MKRWMLHNSTIKCIAVLLTCQQTCRDEKLSNADYLFPDTVKDT